MLNLNRQAAELCDAFVRDARAAAHAAVRTTASGTRLMDCGIDVPGGLRSRAAPGRDLPGGPGQRAVRPVVARVDTPGLAVLVTTDHPRGGLHGFAVRRLADRGRQVLCHGLGTDAGRRGQGSRCSRTIGGTEQGGRGRRSFGNPAVSARRRSAATLAAACGVSPDRADIAAWRRPPAWPARCRSWRASVETALHKLFELGFDLSRVESGFGIAPLPPAAG